MSPAEQKIRQAVSNHIQHEGEDVIRWITGGSTPGVYVTMRASGEKRSVHCPHCGVEHGKFEYGKDAYQQLEQICLDAHHHKISTHS